MFVIIATWLVVYLVVEFSILFKFWCLAKSLDMGDVVLQKSRYACQVLMLLHKLTPSKHNMTEWSSESSSWENGRKPCGGFFSPSGLCHSYLLGGHCHLLIQGEGGEGEGGRGSQVFHWRWAQWPKGSYVGWHLGSQSHDDDVDDDDDMLLPLATLNPKPTIGQFRGVRK
jgi:hypothetical protein